LDPIVIVIVGPTCSGKTNLAIDLALRLKTEIISADSRQVYKYLDIGTAKPTVNQRKAIKHHFIDTLDPTVSFNASKFSIDALIVIDRLHKQKKIPIVAGGSGLYIKALVNGIIDEVESDEAYRNELYALREKYDDEYLYTELVKVDPDSAAKMLPQNWKRVIRALEVYHMTGKPIGYFHSNQQKKNNYIFKQYGLEWDRTKLYENINRRVDEMIDNGLIDEVRSILTLGLDIKINSLNTVGYKEIISFLEGKISLDNTIELMKRNTRHFAKRQMTWFKKDERIRWFKIRHQGELDQISQNIIQSLH
jgi:tRNA dimethylallyltransferase